MFLVTTINLRMKDITLDKNLSTYRRKYHYLNKIEDVKLKCGIKEEKYKLFKKVNGNR